MKKFKLFISGLAVCLFMLACEDPNLPFQQFPELAYGAVARLLSPSTFSGAGSFKKGDLAGSKLTFTVDFYDEDKGKNVESFTFYVKFTDRKNAGANNKAEKSLVTFNSTQFTTHPKYGTQTIDINITYQQVLTALGLDDATVNVGDRFEFKVEIKKKDGKVFTSTNTSSEFVNSPAFGFPMEFRRDVI